jgi:SAM-dependent methyltransferase
MPLMLVVGTINRYPAPGPDWTVTHVDASDRGIWDADHGRNVPVDVQADMRSLPFADASVDRIQSWHALEHVNQQGGIDTIREFARVLAPDGVLDVRVPDLMYVHQADRIDDVLNLIYGDQTIMADAELNVHRWGYTRASLTALLAVHGFASEPTQAEYPDEIRLLARKR